MKKYLYGIIIVIAVASLVGAYVINKSTGPNKNSFSLQAADSDLSSFKELLQAKVTSVKDETEEQNKHYSRITETVNVHIINGSEKGQDVQANYDDKITNVKLQKINVGDTIIIGKISTPDTSYIVLDRYRLNPLLVLAGIFIILAVLFGRIRGFTSLIGLASSIGVLLLFVAPNIIAGKNPTLVTLVGATIIALVSMFFAHGFNKRTPLAVISTLLALGFAEVLAYIFVFAAKLLGNGSADAYYLSSGFLGAIDLQGLLLAGIIIGTLGILNDITIAQVATVEEIHNANTELSASELFRKGSSVGREHIASLINTLVLVYAGTSLPLFLLFTINPNQPLWSILNSETIAEEIIRTLVGSIALILAVPISTGLAAYFFHNEKDSAKKIKEAAIDDY